VQRALRLALRLLSAVAPGAAARVGARLWFAIPKTRISDEARTFLATGERFDARVDGKKVAAWRWGGAGNPVVFLVHGWGGFAGQVSAFVSPLVGAGFRVIAFDAPSHGSSDSGGLGPRHATLFDFSNALITLTHDVGRVAGVIAHSGGCAAVAWALARHDSFRPARVVFVAPFGRPARYMALFQTTLGLSDGAMRRFRELTERRFNFRWSEFEVPEIAERVNTPPLLVVHDKGDRETSWQDGADIAAKWPQAKLLTTTGLGHNRVLRDASVVDASVRFLSSP
jgi:pimeloyl-ACP methyl ester carboxylesterase